MKVVAFLSASIVLTSVTAAYAETEFVGGFRVLQQNANCRANYLVKGAVGSGSYHPVGVGGNRYDSLQVRSETYGESIYQATARFASGNRPTAANAKVSGVLVQLGRFRSFQAGVAISKVEAFSANGTAQGAVGASTQFVIVTGSIATPFADPGQSRRPCVINFVGSYTKRP